MNADVYIDTTDRKLEEIRTGLTSGTLNSMRGVLPDAAVEAACRAAGYEYRRRLLTPVVVVLHMIVAAIWPEDSLAASWQVIWDAMVSRLAGASPSPPGSGTLSKARARLPLGVWTHLFAWVAEQAQTLSEGWDRFCGLRVVLLDGTTVSMPDEPELFEHYGRGRSRGKSYRYPLARLVTFALANTMTVIGYMLGRYDQGETGMAQQLLALLRAGDLLVADRCYAGAHFYARYLASGVEFLTRLHQRVKARKLQLVRSHGKGDFVANMKISGKHQRADPSLPEIVTVRLIHAVVRSRGRRTDLWLATSLLDAQRYSAEQLLELYARRWRIETLFRQFKVSLGADVLRSLTPQGTRKEVAARLIAINLTRTIILQAAREHHADPLRISFVHTIRAVLSFAPAMATRPVWMLPMIYRAMLRQIAAHRVPHRPDRIEPRGIRREKKHYPSLRTTRALWRLSHAA